MYISSRWEASIEGGATATVRRGLGVAISGDSNQEIRTSGGSVVPESWIG
jgi:hypothetical protein